MFKLSGREGNCLIRKVAVVKVPFHLFLRHNCSGGGDGGGATAAAVSSSSLAYANAVGGVIVSSSNVVDASGDVAVGNDRGHVLLYRHTHTTTIPNHHTNKYTTTIPNHHTNNILRYGTPKGEDQD